MKENSQHSVILKRHCNDLYQEHNAKERIILYNSKVNRVNIRVKNNFSSIRPVYRVRRTVWVA